VSDAIPVYLADYGAWALAVTTFLSCLALPVPSSLAMLAAGAFVMAGDLSLIAVATGAFFGAVLGDQAGYLAGRQGGGLIGRARSPLMARAMEDLRHKGGWLVFLSRWLFSPLGPYVNLAAGASGLSWGRFATAGIAGEAVWVALYIGLGMAFAGSLTALAEIMGNLSGLIAALAVAGGAGVWLWRAAHMRGGRLKT
jgi:membrane protein DedA with SNARE-associated domain